MQKDTFLQRWSQFFIQRYKTTILVVVAIILAGVFGAMNNQRQDFPSIPSNFINISASYPGASAEDVEREVVIPIEQSIADLDGVKITRSSAGDNFGNITLEMESVEVTEAAEEEAEKLISSTTLPADAEVDVEIIDVVGPTLVYALTSADASKEEMLGYVDTVTNRILQASPDVQRVDAIPENEFEVAITLDSEQLEEENISGQQVIDAIESQISSIPGGTVENSDGQSLSIRVSALADSLEAIRDIEINDVRLDDVADVNRQPVDVERVTLVGYLNEEGSAVSEDGVYLFVYKQDAGDVITIANAVAEASQEINEDGTLPENITLNEIYDNSVYVQEQIQDLLNNGWLGLGLILLVLMLFINLRTGIVVAAIIPLAFLGTLGVLYAIGFSINILTLFGLLLVLGILVDNAIVIAEGVVHGIENGQTKMEAVRSTMRHLGPAVTAATLTTIVVFIPFASIGGIVGAFLRFIPYTIIIMLVISYFLAITITPVLSVYLLKEETREQRRSQKLSRIQKMLILPALVFYGQRMIDWLEDTYANVIDGLYKKVWKKLLLVAAALGLIAASIFGAAAQLPLQQFPSDDGIALAIDFDFPVEAGFETRRDAIASIMDDAIGITYFQSYYLFEGEVVLVLEDPEERDGGEKVDELQTQLEELIEEDRVRLEEEEEVKVTVSALETGPPTDPFAVTAELRGDGLEDLEAAAADLQAFLEDQDGVIETRNALKDAEVTSIRVSMRDEDLEDKGINPTLANLAVRSVFSEQTIGSVIVRNDGISDDVVVSYSEESTDSVDDLRDVVVGVDSTLFSRPEVTLEEVADITEETSLQSIRRLDGKRVATVQAKVDEDTDGAAVEQAVRDYLDEDKLAAYGLSADDVAYGGFNASVNENFDSLALVFMLAIVAVYLILVYQFNSYTQPGLIMLTVPMALIGVFPALLAIGASIDMISGLGIVALVGIVVNDAIVFVDYFNRLNKERGDKSLREVLVNTGRARFKPILSTSITTIFGILPLTIVDPFWRGLGTSLIAGLICSTIGTLIVFPVLLGWADVWFKKLTDWRERMMKRMKRA